jgi:hypothetical protein
MGVQGLESEGMNPCRNQRVSKLQAEVHARIQSPKIVDESSCGGLGS